MTESKSLGMDTDWTVDPETGRSNSSPLFLALQAEIGRLIRSEGHALIHGQTDVVAGLILAQLAHVHKLAPLATQAGQTDQEDFDARR